MGINLGTRLYTWLRGVEVGRDQCGNRYYRARKGGRVHRDSLRHESRWVIYEGDVEASRVPPEWHAWLHHTTDEIPDEATLRKYDWQRDHQPNLTGTDGAYRPPGSILKGGVRAKGTGDYEPWRPD
jgi:NADH:ubiquinone oxidoreductase subunit